MNLPIICGSCFNPKSDHPITNLYRGGVMGMIHGEQPEPCEGKDWFVRVAVGEGTVTAETGWWCVVRRAFDNCEAHPDRRFLFPDRRIDGHETCGEAVVVRTEQP